MRIAWLWLPRTSSCIVLVHTLMTLVHEWFSCMMAHNFFPSTWMYWDSISGYSVLSGGVDVLKLRVVLPYVGRLYVMKTCVALM